MVWVLVGVVAVWLLMSLKTSRADGTLLEVHPYRRMMPYIMRGRNESVVYYDDYIDAEKLLEYVEAVRERMPVNVTHCLVAAASVGLREVPSMNRFVSGRRLYQRNERVVSFSMKRKRMDKKSKISVVQLRIGDDETFKDLVERTAGNISVERSSKKTYVDKELDLFLRLPRFILDRAVPLFQWLDYNNCLPYAFTKNDAFYSSMFIANLGSLGMSAAYHHLYEWGNCPLFLMVGKIEERPMVHNGAVVPRKVLHLRWSYDERIDDGLTSKYGMGAVRRVLENPFEELGCIAADGSDIFPLGSRSLTSDE